jgi:hypothetical protein
LLHLVVQLCPVLVELRTEDVRHLQVLQLVAQLKYRKKNASTRRQDTTIAASVPKIGEL